MAVYFKVREKQERKKPHLSASKLEKMKRWAAKRTRRQANSLI